MLRLSNESVPDKLENGVNNDKWVAEMRLQFEELNHHIAGAITDKNFARAVALDTARQDILKDLCLKDPALIDEVSLPLSNIVLERTHRLFLR